jgi:hypothetical protein
MKSLSAPISTPAVGYFIDMEDDLCETKNFSPSPRRRSSSERF